MFQYRENEILIAEQIARMQKNLRDYLFVESADKKVRISRVSIW